MTRRRALVALTLGIAGLLLLWLTESALVWLVGRVASQPQEGVWASPAFLWARRALMLVGLLAFAGFFAGRLFQDRRTLRGVAHEAALWRAVCRVSRSTMQLESWEALLQQTCEALVEVPDYIAVGVVVLDADGGIGALVESKFGDRFPALATRMLAQVGTTATRRDPSSAPDAKASVSPREDGEIQNTGDEDGWQGLLAPLQGTGGTILGYLLVETALQDAATEDHVAISALVDDLTAALSSFLSLDEQRRTVAALRNSELRYRGLFEDAPVGIFEATLDGQLISVNQSMAEILKCATPNEALIFFSALVNRLFDTSLRHREFLSGLVRDGKVRDYEFRTYCADGSDVWMLINARLTRRGQAAAGSHGAGDRPMVHGFVRDTTERKRAEAALRESQRILSTLMSNLPGMAYRCQNDSRWTMLFVSEGCRALTGYGPAEILRNEVVSYADLILPGDRARVWTTVQLSLEQGRPYEMEYRIRDADGTVKWVWEQGREVTTPGEPDVLLEGLILDISATKEAEAEREALFTQVQQQAADLWSQAAKLEMQAAQLQQIMATVPEGVVLLDAAQQVVQANPAARHDLALLTDWKPEERLEGRRLSRLGDRQLEALLVPPSTQGLWHEIRAGARLFEALARPLETGPIPEGWVLVLNDVTEERSIVLRTQQQQRLAAVGQLAAGIAHDFNNILAVIVLYCQMALRSPDLPPQVREQLLTITREADRASDLVQQILDFGRQSELTPHPMDLVPFLKEQVRLLAYTFPESIHIELVYASNGSSVSADPSRLAQVIMNLAVNARDAMPEGGELVFTLDQVVVGPEGLSTLPELAPGSWVRLGVHDTGTGIAPEILPRIFEPFYSTKGERGSGLGLSQVHGIVAQHGGAVDVTSAAGEGTTFHVYLPALDRERDKRKQSALPEETGVQSPAGHGERLLFAEANSVLRRILATALRGHGYEVLEVDDGAEALQHLEGPSGDGGGEIALVLSDSVMPNVGGPALLRAMRARGLNVPVLMLGEHAMKREMDELEEGLAGWVLKPVDRDRLMELVGDVLGGRRRESGA
ncbi:MAG: PAS domain S-box protein [Anaerolineae bacterium]|nr:PAS domain S-box protein [Anaerolineae bacterium]